jgi:hypothetical protein
MMSSPVAASEDLAKILEREPNVAMNWHHLGMALAREGKTQDLLALCDRAAPLFGNPIRFFHNLAIDLCKQKAWRVFSNLAQNIPTRRLEQPIAVYYLGCEQIEAGRYVRALEYFHEFKQAVQPRHASYPLTNDANFNTIYRQGTLPEGPENTARILAGVPTAASAKATLHTPAKVSNGDYVLAVSMDKGYFLRFAEELFEGYEKLGLSEPLHFHVVAPDASCIALFERLQKEHQGLNVALSTEPEGPWNNPVYYTCARFFVLNRIFDWYDKTVLFMDGDSLPTCHPSKFLAGLEGAHFACIKTERNEPASVYQAGIMVFANTPKTRDFADNVARFAMAKLDTPQVLAWMLDQAALISVLVLLSEADPEFRFANLRETAGTMTEGFLRNLSNDAEKNALMNARP